MKELDNNGTRHWDTGRVQKRQRLERADRFCKGRFITNGNVVKVLEALLNPGDRVCIEGNNQKQADYLSRMLAQVDPAMVHDLHLLTSVLGRPEHLDLFQ